MYGRELLVFLCNACLLPIIIFPTGKHACSVRSGVHCMIIVKKSTVLNSLYLGIVSLAVDLTRVSLVFHVCMLPYCLSDQNSLSFYSLLFC